MGLVHAAVVRHGQGAQSPPDFQNLVSGSSGKTLIPDSYPGITESYGTACGTPHVLRPHRISPETDSRRRLMRDVLTETRTSPV